MSRLQEIVSLEYRVNKSFEGKYFMGHTPVLGLNGNSNSWGGLVNPRNSGINLYVNTFTVSNNSPLPFNAQIWLNSAPPGRAMTSPYASPANTAICPLPIPKTSVMYAQDAIGTPTNGASIFTRISDPNSTVVGNYYGKIVIPPGGTFIVFLLSPTTQLIKAEVAFGWWEDNI